MDVKTNTIISVDLNTHQQRNSFNRFDDDLCQLILGFLSFTTKIRFELVCKQWKRCIYKNQQILKVYANQFTPNTLKECLNTLLEPITVSNYVSCYAKSMNMQNLNKIAFKSLLEKCKNIKNIEFQRCFVDLEILDIIGANCQYLESLKFDILGLDKKDIESFGIKYAKKLKHVCINRISLISRDNFFCNHFSKIFATHCYNLESIVCEDISIINDTDSQFLPKLENLDLMIFSNDVINFTNLVDKYWNSIKKLKLYSNEIDQLNFRNILNQISRFKNIRDLNINFRVFTQSNSRIDDKIIEISENCLKLNRLVFAISNPFNEFELFSSKIFDCFGKFTSINCLKLSLQAKNEIIGTIECFKNCIRLVHLTILCSNIGDIFFKNIDNYLPNVKYLNIFTDNDITDDFMYTISNLRKLLRIELGSNKAFKFITDFGICGLLNSNSIIRQIVLHSRPKITSFTIDELIKRSLKKPKTNFLFYSGFSHTGDEASFNQIDMNKYQQLPPNLQIFIITGVRLGNERMRQNEIQMDHHIDQVILPFLRQPIVLRAPVLVQIDGNGRTQVRHQRNSIPIQSYAMIQHFNQPWQVQQCMQHIYSFVQAHHDFEQMLVNNPN